MAVEAQNKHIKENALPDTLIHAYVMSEINASEINWSMTCDDAVVEARCISNQPVLSQVIIGRDNGTDMLAVDIRARLQDLPTDGRLEICQTLTAIRT